MNYQSTRDPNNLVTASQAILQGLAVDGGLYVPTELPKFDLDWNEVKDSSYQELAIKILTPFLADFTDDQVRDCVEAAYDEKFDDEAIAPLVKVGDNYHLELFHGATIAFKDMALSILPHLMKTAAQINGSDAEIIILTATSGDTGKAAMEGFADVEGTKIIVFYPEGGVSSIQEKQMVSQTGDNTYVISIIGNFDDAQSEVKRLFNDPNLREELASINAQFSSANSMNIGRLVPQIVYYFYAYAQLVKQGALKPGEKMNVTVPTGNFGNILAAYYAKESGLPIDKLICASNDNKVLYDFFQSGTYDKNRPFELTISPSMDILLSSNFERLVYHAVGNQTDVLVDLMASLEETGSYTVPEEYRDNFADFIGEWASEAETQEEIKQVFDESDYLMDTHTAVASKSLRKVKAKGLNDRPNVVVSTASPYKFPVAVLESLGIEAEDKDDQAVLDKVEEVSGLPQPPAVDGLVQAPVLHDQTVTVPQMREAVRSIAHES